MNTRKLMVVILISFLLLSACAPGQLEALSQAAGQGSGEDQPEGESGVTGEVVPLLAGRSGDVDSPPAQEGGSGGNVYSPSDQSGGSGGIITSSGEQWAGAQVGNEAGESQSFSANAPSASTGMSQPVKWLTYTDETHRFSIQYPDSYVILPEVELRSGNVSNGLVTRVRFQDRQLASGEFAELEPPQFTVEVFTLPGNAPLESFISSNVNLESATIEPYTSGELSGFRVSTGLMLAPNEFYFFAGPGFVYKLTPLGEHGKQMLQSFRILQP